MIFKGKNNQTIEFQILNYQFPEMKKGSDANWLEIFLKLRFKEEVIRIVDPCLETFEVQELIDWLEYILNGRGPE